MEGSLKPASTRKSEEFLDPVLLRQGHKANTSYLQHVPDKAGYYHNSTMGGVRYHQSNQQNVCSSFDWPNDDLQVMVSSTGATVANSMSYCQQDSMQYHVAASTSLLECRGSSTRCEDLDKTWADLAERNTSSSKFTETKKSNGGALKRKPLWLHSKVRQEFNTFDETVSMFLVKEE